MPDAETFAHFLAVQNLIAGKWLAQAVGVAARLGVADLLRDGPRPCDELARSNQVDERALYRLLRALASVGVFREVEGTDRAFALTGPAEFLRSDVPGSLRAVAIMAAADFTWRPWADLFGSVKTGDTAFERTYGVPVFEYLATHPADASVFDAAMTGWSTQNAHAVAESYDFAGIKTLMDVGGGHGYLLATVLKANPGMRGILFETPQVAAGAGDLLAGLDAEVVAGDFFAAIPPGADACILKSVIHDWDDRRATTILGHCRDAVGPGGKVLLAEMVIPPGNDPHVGKLLDLEMLVMAGGHERTEDQFRDLLAASGIRLTRIVPTPSPTCVIEGVVEG